MMDLIGDIHGHADELEELLRKLGYKKTGQTYSHPNRRVLFVGDYIDRGPRIRDTLQIVKAMVDSDNAIALMGNHEYNALCFHEENPRGGHLRKHTIKNIVQHKKTLKQFQEYTKEYEAYLDWFTTLPLYHETDEFRAIHACWDEASVEFLRKNLDNDRLTKVLIHQSAEEGSPLYEAIEQTLKGKEIRMPDGHSFKDKDGAERRHIRIKWWEDPAKMTYKSISVEPIANLPDEPIDLSKLKSHDFYDTEEKKVFFGHYWLKGEPSLYKKNICCLDYSVAEKGKLVAYRMDGEKALDEINFVYV